MSYYVIICKKLKIIILGIMKQTKKVSKIPSVREIEGELRRLRHKRNYYKALRNTICGLITVAAIAVLVAVLYLPVLKIYGNSMAPTLQGGDIVLSVKTDQFKSGDIVAFYYNNKILVKRVIASAGEWVDIDEEGNVYVNQTLLEEPYLSGRALGDCNIELPYQVPDGKLFLMGDHRSVSVDSRNTAIGCVSEEQIVGELKFRIWPLKYMGRMD